MKILFVLDTLSYAGASKMIVDVATAMSHKHKCSLYAYASPVSPVTIPDEVEFIPGTPYINNRAFRHIVKIGEIRKKIKSENPDLIVAFMPYPSILTILAKIGLNVRIVISERGDPAVYGGFIKLFGHRIISKADGAVFQTEGARCFYSGPFYERSVVIPNAITIRKAERIPWNERKNQIAFVGRFFNKQKRQDLMVEAFVHLASKYPNLLLVFYGDGDDLERIRKLVEKHGLVQRVRFAGKVSQIELFLRESKLFVLTSDYEGIPNALIEAMCVGLPCVATDCSPGGARLLIKNGDNGLLVQCDNVEAIVKACEKVLDNPDEAERLGIAAQDICEEYSPEIIYPQWNSYLEKVAFN